MSAAVTHPAHPAHAARPVGATAVQGSRQHRLGDALHAVKVFAGAVFDVLILGEYGEEAGTRRK
ncbi:hypothetical protein [Streptomyces triticisoli]|jgi:hypothetical protein|uniref:hypothetical protein n=1 Tax=Streptomyces triticisoli TaxID=2182797 RepID=UPI000DDB7AEB|nr:hypothetical protein [Streptomyces triticisoli]